MSELDQKCFKESVSEYSFSRFCVYFGVIVPSIANICIEKSIGSSISLLKHIEIVRFQQISSF